MVQLKSDCPTHLTFECGCTLPKKDGVPYIEYNKLNMECPKTWALYQKGFTQSIFQLESTGKEWSKRLRPKSIEDAAALISIIRPGTLQSFDENGKSLTDIYCQRQNSPDWKVDSSDPLAPILGQTNMINIYQESTLKIAQDIAGFDGASSMKLLKGVGKKNAEVLFALEKEFIEGCDKIGIVSHDEAIHIFDNIKASARYSFNKSHAVSYAVLGYYTAWVKAHLPYHYLCAWLRNAKNSPDKIQEIRKIASEARRLNIPISVPSIKNLPRTDFFVRNKTLYFGLDSIKHCGTKSYQKILEIPLEFSTWLHFLVHYSQYLNKTHMVSMIRVGCFDCFGGSRIEKEFEYLQWSELTGTQQRSVRSKFSGHKNLVDLMREVSTPKTDTIVDTLLNPPYSLKDNGSNIIEHERELMGISISRSAITRKDLPDTLMSTKDVARKRHDHYVLVGQIEDFREFKIKKGTLAGQYMGVFRLVDTQGECEVVCFPTQLIKYEAALYDNNVIILGASQSKRGTNIIVEEIFET